MSRNDLRRIPAPGLADRARLLAEVAAARPGVYPMIPIETLTEIEASAAEVDAGIEAVVGARNAYRAAVRDRRAAERRCAEAMADAARRVGAIPETTPEAVAALGLAPRKTARTRVVPKTPTQVVASVLPNGEILLRWHRSGNGEEVIFVVECARAGGPWTYVESATRTRLRLRGFAPGVPVAFRVRATKSGASASPSSVATVYGGL